MAFTPTDTIDQRAATYDRLMLRNRVVSVLRVLLPALGVVAFVMLCGQIYVASVARQYGVSGIRIDRGSVVVDTPHYSATGKDGVRYAVSAGEARAPIADTKAITMSDAIFDIERTGEPKIRITAPRIETDGEKGRIGIPGTARVVGDDGLEGTVAGLVSDTHTGLTTTGAIDIRFADGSRLAAAASSIDSKARLLTFTNVTMVVDRLPEAAK